MTQQDGSMLPRPYPLSMKIAGALAGVAFLAMAGAIARGFLQGDFAGEGRILLSLTWGQVSLLDVYLGFCIFSGWILYREGRTFSFVLWFLLMMTFGNATASCYILWALSKSGGDWNVFWLGSGPIQARR